MAYPKKQKRKTRKGELTDMKKYQIPVMETIVFSTESIMSASGNEPDVLFDASLLDDGFGEGGNG